MPYLAGLLGGFRQAADEAATRKQQDEQAMREREGKIFESLISSTDPEIQSLAVSGLLESATPSKRPSGIRRWLGEATANPNLAYIQRLLRPTAQQAPSGASAAQAEVGATEPGAPEITGGMMQPPTRPRMAFDPAVRAQQVAQGTLTGRLGALEGALPGGRENPNWGGLVLGVGGAPQSVKAGIPVTFVHRDGSRSVGFADPGSNTLLGSDGKPLAPEVLATIVDFDRGQTRGAVPRQSSTMTREQLISQLQREGRADEIAELPAGTHFKVTLNLTDNSVMGYAAGSAPPLSAIAGRTQTTEPDRNFTSGLAYVTRDMTGREVSRVEAPARGEPEAVADAAGVLRAVDKKALLPGGGGAVDPFVQEREAKLAGYANYADLVSAAQRGINRTGATPPVRIQPSALPPPGQNIDPNAVMNYIRQRRTAP